MDKYEQLSIIGEGSYGLVMKCRHRESDQLVAIKKFLETEEDATIRKMALREIRMLKRLKHENLVTMIEVFRYRKRFYLVFEFLAGTVLDELDKMPGGLGDERSRERIYQVTRAISYCHSNYIIHRDVKPENVLVSSLGVVKLCDFGFARLAANNGEPCTEYVATRWYRAPELLVGEPIYGFGVDIWAIGCLFAEMMTGDPLFPGESDIDQMYLIVKLLGKPCLRHMNLLSKNIQMKAVVKIPKQLDEHSLHTKFASWQYQAVDFLSYCIKMDPQVRLTADELLKHSYFIHDRFPQRFLPALREKVNTEFNNPLLRKYKTEILMSTDKKDESRTKRSLANDKWRFTLTESNSTKRKFTLDSVQPEVNKSTQKSITASIQKSKDKPEITTPKLLHTNNAAEIQMLEKSLESLVKFNHKGDTVRPNSVHKEEVATTLLTESPPPFQSLHFGFGDYNKSPNNHPILHPSIHNISFNKDPPKRSPNVLQNINNTKTSQVPLLNNSRTKFLKKLERNVQVDNIFGNGDQGSQIWGNTPIWYNSLRTNEKNKEKKTKNNEFSLPNLPGATISPNKTKKKSLPEIELPHSTEVTPRIQSSTSQKSSTSTQSSNLLNLN